MPACVCALATPIALRTKVLVLVHRIEAFKTTNTGRLAALSLGARLERWGARDGTRPALPEGPILLLFPFDEARPLERADAERDATLVVPDGNWPQARKIARRVREGAEERVTIVRLEGERPTGYQGLRRTRREHALSTLEAIAHALRVLEGERGPEVAAQTLALFDAFAARHAMFARGVRAEEAG